MPVLSQPRWRPSTQSSALSGMPKPPSSTQSSRLHGLNKIIAVEHRICLLSLTVFRNHAGCERSLLAQKGCIASYEEAAMLLETNRLRICCVRCRSDNWCNFPDRYCCVHLLDPLEPLFQDIGSAFIEARHCHCHLCMRSLPGLQAGCACTVHTS